MTACSREPAGETARAGFLACDLCGGRRHAVVLRSKRLDGPLIRCSSCGLVYVGQREQDFTFREVDERRAAALAARVEELGIVRCHVEDAERPQRVLAEIERLAAITREVPGGTLLDVGCATGSFLRVAGSRFDAYGVEPNPWTSQEARKAGLNVVTGTTADAVAPARGFDVVTLFHVIEHVDSPRRVLRMVRELMRDGGIVAIETPTIDSAMFKVMRSRWRQLLPDHYFFFSRETLEYLMARSGFTPVRYAKVGRRASIRFIADRARRMGIPIPPFCESVLEKSGLAERTVYVKPGDIMMMIGRAR
jgi:2-polyprenyl-3-methyl-5-hydroxy-6-metoxy-1,4-benzoquinol methylase